MKRKRAQKLQLRIEIDPSDKKAETWYTDSTKLIKELYGDYWTLFVDLLAATSPRAQVKKNWRIADAILSAYLDRAKRPDKLLDVLTSKAVLPAHLNNIIRALQGRTLSGDKVKRFAANLKGNLSDVTIDVWICKAYGIDQKKLTPNLKPTRPNAAYCLQIGKRFYGMPSDALQANEKNLLFPSIGLYSRKRLVSPLCKKIDFSICFLPKV
jgi:hypothetical protein